MKLKKLIAAVLCLFILSIFTGCVETGRPDSDWKEPVAGEPEIPDTEDSSGHDETLESDNDALDLLAIPENPDKDWVLNDKYINEKIMIAGVAIGGGILNNGNIIKNAPVTRSVPSEWMHEKDKRPNKAILHLHGGAYMFDLDFWGSLYRRMAEKYCDVSGAGVLTVDYRVAPQDTFPAALEDAMAGYLWLLSQGYSGKDIIIAGDSAGGGLSLALTLCIRNNGLEMPGGIIGMSPWVNLFYWYIWTPPYAPNALAVFNPLISPIYGNFKDFPPVLIQVGTADIIIQVDSFADKLANEYPDVPLTYTVFPDQVHVFQIFFGFSDAADSAWLEVEGWIGGIFAG